VATLRKGMFSHDLEKISPSDASMSKPHASRASFQIAKDKSSIDNDSRYRPLES